MGGVFPVAVAGSGWHLFNENLGDLEFEWDFHGL